MTIQSSSPSLLLCCLLATIIAAPSLVRGSMAAQRSSFWSPKITTTAGFGGKLVVSDTRQNNININNNNHYYNMLLTSLRGGSSTVEEMAEEDEEENEETSTTTTEKVPAIASMEPVRLFISTNWGNSVIDQTVELTPVRTRTVASLKKSLSKQLPGRPPIVALDLVYEGRILDDDTLVEELFEDEDEDEEEDDDDDDIEEGNEAHRKLTLNIVPPVDPKFATELGPKLVYYNDDDDDAYVADSAGIADAESLTTDELVDAYYLNQVAMSQNAQLLADPNIPSSPYMRLELQEQARQLKEQLQTETPVDVWEKCMDVSTQKSSRHTRDEWRGERYRSGKGGVTTQIKTIIQTNLNVVRMTVFFAFLLKQQASALSQLNY